MEGSTASQNNTQQAHGNMSNFFVVVTGETCGAHERFIKKLEHKGQIQKKSVEESDYILAFCPSPSRTVTDVQEAMRKIPSGKPVILVVMHHRHDVEAYLDDSSRHVSREDVITVDTVFWEGVFLKCSHNKEAFRKVLKAVGYSSTTGKPAKKALNRLSSACSLFSTSTSERKIAEDSEKQIFNVFMTGETCGAHETLVGLLEDTRQIQNKSVEESDYILAFCPSPSRTATDVQEAMGKIPSGKPVILVVMHHKHSVPAHLDDSSRHVTREDVILTVDTLFWEGVFLKCSYNEEAFSKVLTTFQTTLKSTENDSLEGSALDTGENEKETFVDPMGKKFQLHPADGCSDGHDERSEQTASTKKATIQETSSTSELPSTAPREQLKVKSPPSDVTCTSEKKIKKYTESEPWKIFGDKDTLLDIVKEFHPVASKHVRILLLGPVGSGKSSFINSVSSVLRGRMTRGAHVDAIAGDTSYTTKYQTHTIKRRNKQNFPFVFNDIVGLGSEDDIKLVLEGHVKDGYMFGPVSAMSDYKEEYPKPEDKTQVLVLVIRADQMTTSSLDFKKIKDIAVNMGIPRICILTKIDEACPSVKKDVKHVYKSKNLQEKMEEVSTKVGIPVNHIFPVKNYHEETDLDDDIDVLILNALQHMIYLGEDFINQMESAPMSLD